MLAIPPHLDGLQDEILVGVEIPLVEHETLPLGKTDSRRLTASTTSAEGAKTCDSSRRSASTTRPRNRRSSSGVASASPGSSGDGIIPRSIVPHGMQSSGPSPWYCSERRYGLSARAPERAWIPFCTRFSASGSGQIPGRTEGELPSAGVGPRWFGVSTGVWPTSRPVHPERFRGCRLRRQRGD